MTSGQEVLQTRRARTLVSAPGHCVQDTWHSSWTAGLVEALGWVSTGAQSRTPCPRPGCALLTDAFSLDLRSSARPWALCAA